MTLLIFLVIHLSFCRRSFFNLFQKLYSQTRSHFEILKQRAPEFSKSSSSASLFSAVPASRLHPLFVQQFDLGNRSHDDVYYNAEPNLRNRLGLGILDRRSFWEYPRRLRKSRRGDQDSVLQRVLQHAVHGCRVR